MLRAVLQARIEALIDNEYANLTFVSGFMRPTAGHLRLSQLIILVESSRGRQCLPVYHLTYMYI